MESSPPLQSRSQYDKSDTRQEGKCDYRRFLSVQRYQPKLRATLRTIKRQVVLIHGTPSLFDLRSTIYSRKVIDFSAILAEPRDINRQRIAKSLNDTQLHIYTRVIDAARHDILADIEVREAATDAS